MLVFLHSLAFAIVLFAHCSLTVKAQSQGIAIDTGTVLAQCTSEVTSFASCAPNNIESCSTCYQDALQSSVIPSTCSEAQDLVCNTMSSCASSCGGDECSSQLESLVVCTVSAVTNGTLEQNNCEIGNCASSVSSGNSTSGGSQNGAGGSQNGAGGSQNGAGGSQNGAGDSQNGAGDSQNGAGGSQNGAGGSQNGADVPINDIAIEISKVVEQCSSEVSSFAICAPNNIESCGSCYLGKLNTSALPTTCAEGQDLACSTIETCTPSCGNEECLPQLVTLIKCAITSVTDGMLVQDQCEIVNCDFLQDTGTSSGSQTNVDVQGHSVNISAIISQCSSEGASFALCAPSDLQSCSTCYQGALNSTSIPTSCSEAQDVSCKTIETCTSSCGGDKCSSELVDLINCAVSTAAEQYDCELESCDSSFSNINATFDGSQGGGATSDGSQTGNDNTTGGSSGANNTTSAGGSQSTSATGTSGASRTALFAGLVCGLCGYAVLVFGAI